MYSIAPRWQAHYSETRLTANYPIWTTPQGIEARLLFYQTHRAILDICFIMDEIPIEIAIIVFSYLNESDILSCRLVCSGLSKCAAYPLFKSVAIWFNVRSIQRLINISHNNKLRYCVRELRVGSAEFHGELGGHRHMYLLALNTWNGSGSTRNNEERPVEERHPETEQRRSRAKYLLLLAKQEELYENGTFLKMLIAALASLKKLRSLVLESVPYKTNGFQATTRIGPGPPSGVRQIVTILKAAIATGTHFTSFHVLSSSVNSLFGTHQLEWLSLTGADLPPFMQGFSGIQSFRISP
jgi:F-box domain